MQYLSDKRHSIFSFSVPFCFSFRVLATPVLMVGLMTANCICFEFKTGGNDKSIFVPYIVCFLHIKQNLTIDIRYAC